MDNEVQKIVAELRSTMEGTPHLTRSLKIYCHLSSDTASNMATKHLAPNMPRPIQGRNFGEENSTNVEKKGSLRRELIVSPDIQERVQRPRPILAHKESREELEKFTNSYLCDVKLEGTGPPHCLGV
jgi:hypothetical protein